jgi:hypothetical protein
VEALIVVVLAVMVLRQVLQDHQFCMRVAVVAMALLVPL